MGARAPSRRFGVYEPPPILRPVSDVTATVSDDQELTFTWSPGDDVGGDNAYSVGFELSRNGGGYVTITIPGVVAGDSSAIYPNPGADWSPGDTFIVRIRRVHSPSDPSEWAYSETFYKTTGVFPIGTTTLDMPPGVYNVEAYTGGGGGSVGGSLAGGGGGGGSGYIMGVLTVTETYTIVVTVGSGGTGGTGEGVAADGVSISGSDMLVTSIGGGGGSSSGAAGTGGSFSLESPGSGSVTFEASVNQVGGDGGHGSDSGALTGAGGGGNGTFDGGGRRGDNGNVGGAGGLDGSDNPSGGAGGVADELDPTAGEDAVIGSYGGGGGGAGGAGGESATAGGNGAAGYLIIYL